MKRSMEMKKGLISALALLLVLMSVVSCNKSGEEQVTTAATTPAAEQTTAPVDEQETTLSIVADGKTDVVIVFPGGETEIGKVSAKLRSEIYSKYKVRLETAEDRYLPADPNRAEILIGMTDRQESQSLLLELKRSRDYIIRLQGNKLVMMGQTAEGLEKAVEYFINKCMLQSEQKDTLVYDAAYDRTFEAKYKVKLTSCDGKNFNFGQIVYPAGGYQGEYYAALMLYRHLYEAGGMIMEVVPDSKPVKGTEILIGQTNRGAAAVPAEKKFNVSINKGSLQVAANDLYGYIDATSFLLNNLFSQTSLTTNLEASFSYTGDAKTVTKQTTEYRVMFQNIWGVNEVIENRDDYAAALALAYSPDIIGFNEYYNHTMDKLGVLKNTLLANGYAKAPAGNGDKGKNGESVLFYKTATLNLLEDRHILFQYTEPKSGQFINSDVTAHIGVFESKATGEKFITVAIHFESNRYNDTAESGNKFYATGVQNRKSQADVLMRALNDLKDTYGELPMILGGDYNSPAKGRTVAGQTFEDVCEYLIKQYGWKDCHTTAAQKDHESSTHGHPNFSEEHGFYTDGNYSSTSSYEASIDHIFQYGDAIEAKNFDTIMNAFASVISDHFPVLLDFNIK